MRRARSTALLLLPSSGIFTLVFAAPLLAFFVVSFWRQNDAGLIPDFTLANYGTAFSDYARPLVFTFSMALIISLITTSLAFALAYVIRFHAGRYSMALLFLVLLTLFGGYLAKVYVWKTILGQTGLFNNALMTFGLIQEPIAAFLYNPIAVVITLSHYLVPLAVLPIYGSLRSIEDSPLHSARDLGASPYLCFRDIVLPQCQTGLFAAFALTFLFVAGDWVTPKLVGGPHTSMIGTFIEYQYGSRFNPPMGSAMAFSVIAISVLMVGCVAVAGRLVLRPR
jgi:spermidine/putrescine transport system permease protein